jgi:L-seryl-tRNA(Ser) seleniumtransferase
MEATLLSYLRGRAVTELPVWQMIATAEGEIRRRAEHLCRRLQERGIAAEVMACRSAIGGGSTPGETLASTAVALGDATPDRLAAALRQGDPPVVGRIADGRLLLDLRTVLPEQDALLPDLIATARGAAAERGTNT